MSQKQSRTIRKALSGLSLFGLVATSFVPNLGLVGPAEAQSAESGYSWVLTRGTEGSSMPAPKGGSGNFDEHGFRFFCVPSHFSFDDPVVYPGQVGAAHLHMFFGNVAVDAHSTSDSIVNSGRVSCDGGLTNRSAYWVPALFNENDEVVLPSSINLYYKSWVNDRSLLRPIPPGLQILANGRVPGSSGVGVSSVPSDLWGKSIRVGGAHNHVTVEILFPDCIAVDANGDPVLSSPGGTRHVAYSSGSCPRSHPYNIPQLTQIVGWNGVPFDSNWYFSSDKMFNSRKGTSVHADYMAGWTPESALIMANCVRDAFRECGPGLQRHWQDQFFAPDGEQVYDFFKLADGVDHTPAELAGWPAMLPGHVHENH